MPRTSRASIGGLCYHIINRGNAKADVFHHAKDYQDFLQLIQESLEERPMRVLAYCLMPNHFHLLVWPRRDGDLSQWMQWIMTTHVRRYHRDHQTSGHIWQGRFKAFPIQQDEHLLTVWRYIERNPVRARLVKRAEEWRWSSCQTQGPWMHQGPVPQPPGWKKWVNKSDTDMDLETIRQSVNRGTSFGSRQGSCRQLNRLGLEASMNPRGRPRTKS